MDSTTRQAKTERLIAEINAGLKNLHRVLAINKLSYNVESAIKKVPRDKFIEEDQQKFAFEDTPLPIGYGQTISQPSIVAIMTELLDITKEDRILEIGTGSGYQAAILAQLAKEVYTIEVVRQLADKAEARFQALGYTNIHLNVGNGRLGWVRHAPYDKIILTASATKIPPALVEQLKPGGRMILPFGSQRQTQMMTIIDKDIQGDLKSTPLFPVKFVPFV